MDFWSAAMTMVVLVLVAGAMMAGHVRVWRSARQPDLPPRDRDYHRRRFRRRMQSSAMVGLVGVAIFVGYWIQDPPLLVVVYWSGVLLLVAWLGLLAMADIVSTAHHFGRMREDVLIEQARLEARARRIRHAQGNGRRRTEDPSILPKPEAQRDHPGDSCED